MTLLPPRRHSPCGLRPALLPRPSRHPLTPLALRSLLSRRLLPFLLLLFGGSGLLPSPVQGAESDAKALASFLLPGTGQLANSDYGAAFLHASTFLALRAQTQRLKDDPRVKRSGLNESLKTYFTNRTDTFFRLYNNYGGGVMFYSGYAAYRDDSAGGPSSGFLPSPSNSLGELALSPFQGEFLFRMGTLVPLAIVALAASSEPSKDDYLMVPDKTISYGELRAAAAVGMLPVGLGEEAFFRGYLNHSLSNSFGENWGLGLSSLIFGAAHKGEGVQAAPLAAGIFGVYLGFLQQRNGYDIRQGVVIHYWWNTFSSLALLRKRKEAQILLPFSFSF